MPKFIFSNFGSAQLLLPVAANDPTLTVQEMQGNLFPNPNPDQGERFSLVLRKPDGTPEVMHCWKREGDVLHVLRGKEGTEAHAWDVGEWVSLRTTAEALNDWAQADVGAFVVDGEHYFDVESLDIAPEHVFEDAAERDTYFTANPGELVDQVAILMADGFYVYVEADTEWINTPPRDNYFELFPEELVSGLPIWLAGDLQVWDAGSEAWRYVTAYIQGPMGPVGDVIQDVVGARDVALVEIDGARVAALSDIGDASAIVLAGSNFAGPWSDLSGEHLDLVSVFHDGKYWFQVQPIADIAMSEPGVSADWVEFSVIPSVAGQAGKVLVTDGESVLWDEVDTLPDQAGHAGKVLQTDGSTPSWGIPDTFPDQAEHSGKFLSTDGATPFWHTVEQRKITTSPSAPSGGVEGEIWLRY